LKARSGVRRNLPRNLSRQVFLLVVTAVLLGACASLPPPRGADHHYAGRFSLSVTRPDPASDGPQRDAWTGRFALQVDGQSLTLDLVSPLGSTIARFETDAREARLLVPSNGGVRVDHGSDAQALSEQVLGWSLPVAGMPDWVEGRPSGARPFHMLPDEAGNVRFEQDGWSVTVEPATVERPGRRLQMERAGQAGSPDVALRVVLDGPPS
jgi:outer membrane lipoprotein LolB